MKRAALLALIQGAVALSSFPGCVPTASLPSEAQADADEKWEFQQALLADVDKIDTFVLKTQRGINLPEMTVGWFAMILLNELCSQDQLLYDHMHVSDGNVESYLRTTFQNDPKAEIVIVGSMASKGNTALRLAARHTLETLTAIPNPKESAELQAADRKNMLTALTRLRGTLMQVVAESMPAY